MTTQVIIAMIVLKLLIVLVLWPAAAYWGFFYLGPWLR